MKNFKIDDKTSIENMHAFYSYSMSAQLTEDLKSKIKACDEFLFKITQTRKNAVDEKARAAFLLDCRLRDTKFFKQDLICTILQDHGIQDFYYFHKMAVANKHLLALNNEADYIRNKVELYAHASEVLKVNKMDELSHIVANYSMDIVSDSPKDKDKKIKSLQAKIIRMNTSYKEEAAIPENVQDSLASVLLRYANRLEDVKSPSATEKAKLLKKLYYEIPDHPLQLVTCLYQAERILSKKRNLFGVRSGFFSKATELPNSFKTSRHELNLIRLMISYHHPEIPLIPQETIITASPRELERIAPGVKTYKQYRDQAENNKNSPIL